MCLCDQIRGTYAGTCAPSSRARAPAVAACTVKARWSARQSSHAELRRPELGAGVQLPRARRAAGGGGRRGPRRRRGERVAAAAGSGRVRRRAGQDQVPRQRRVHPGRTCPTSRTRTASPGPRGGGGCWAP